MNAHLVPDAPIDPRKLNVARPTNSLTRLLAWLLVFVLVSFVGVSVWFMMRVHQMREEFADACAMSSARFGGNGGSKRGILLPDIERVEDPLLALREHARRLETLQHALDEGGGMETAGDGLVTLLLRPTSVSGWETEYLKSQFHRCVLDLPREAVSLEDSLDRFPASSFFLATFGSWAAPSTDEGTATSADERLVAFGIRNTVHLWDQHEGRLRHVLRVARSPAERLAFSGDGRRLLVANRLTIPAEGEADKITGRLEVWDTQTARRLLTIGAHEGAIRKAALTQDGMRALTVGEDGRVKVWNLAPAERILAGDRVRPLGLAFEPDANTIAALGEDGKVRRWHAWSGKRLPTVTLAGFDAKMTNAILSGDGGLIAAIGADRRARVWDAHTGKLRWTDEVPGKGSKVLLAFSSAGNFLASARGPELCVWRTEDGGFHRDRTCLETASAITFNRDGWLYCYDVELRLRAWNPTTDEVQTYFDHPTCNPIRKLLPRTLPGNHRPISIGEQAIESFKPDEKPVDAYLRRAPDPIRDAILSHDGKRIVAVCEGGRLVVWDAKTGVQLAAFRTDAAGSRLAFSHDGQCLAIAGIDGTIRLLDSASAADPVAIETYSQPVTTIARSGTGALVIGHKGGAWGEWDGTTARTLSRYRPIEGDILALQASNNEASVVYRTPRGQTRTHCTVGENDLILNEPGWVAMSPCGQGLVSVPDGGREIRFHSLNDSPSAPRQTVPGVGKISALAYQFDTGRLAIVRGESVWIGKREEDDWSERRFGSDITAVQIEAPNAEEKSEKQADERLAVGTRDGRVWLAGIGALPSPVVLRPFLASAVRQLHLSPNRKYLAAGDDVGNVHVWELANRRLIRTYRHVGPIGALSLSDHKLAIGCGDGATWLHDVTRR